MQYGIIEMCKYEKCARLTSGYLSHARSGESRAQEDHSRDKDQLSSGRTKLVALHVRCGWKSWGFPRISELEEGTSGDLTAGWRLHSARLRTLSPSFAHAECTTTHHNRRRAVTASSTDIAKSGGGIRSALVLISPSSSANHDHIHSTWFITTSRKG